MGIWRSASVAPGGGFADRSWDLHGDEDNDAFARSAVRVCALFNAALPELGLPLPQHSELRLSLHLREHRPKAPPGSPVTVRIDALAREGFHMGHVTLPDGVAELTPTARGLLVLDVLQVAGDRLADLAGWDRVLLQPAIKAVLDAALEFSWSSVWKKSPDRRHQARMTYRLGDDGMGRARIEVSDGTSVSATPERYCPRGYTHVAKTLRWTGSTSLSFERSDAGRLAPAGTPGIRPSPSHESDLERIDIAELAPLPRNRSVVDPATPRPTVLEFVPEPGSRNRVYAGSGGDGDFTPLAYTDVLQRTMALLRNPDWVSWWAAGNLGPLEITFWLGRGPETLTYDVRRIKDSLDTAGGYKFVAVLKRPHGSVPSDVDPAVVARDDVVALMAKVRKRANLGPHPPIPQLVADDDRIREGS